MQWRRSSSGWRPTISSFYKANEVERSPPFLRVCCPFFFEILRRDFSDSLTICNYNLPSTINIHGFRLKLCRCRAAFVVCVQVYTRQSTHSPSLRRSVLRAFCCRSTSLRLCTVNRRYLQSATLWGVDRCYVSRAPIANRQLFAAISFGGSTR